MAASQSEITQQVSRSSDVARQAAHEAEEIDTTVQGLVQATDKIGAIVGMINAIAAQTNLLALNATIEAPPAPVMRARDLPWSPMKSKCWPTRQPRRPRKFPARSWPCRV